MAVIGRPRAFDRAAALDAAMLVFWRKGFAAASMNDLCDAMGIHSPSLYAAFESKEALYIEAMDRYVRTVGPALWDTLDQGVTARISMEALLMAGADAFAPSADKPAGCMALLSGVSDEWPDAIGEVTRSVRLQLLGRLSARLNTAVMEGELPPSTDIESVSRFYLSFFQGMAVQARDGTPPNVLKGMVGNAMAAWPNNA